MPPVSLQIQTVVCQHSAERVQKSLCHLANAIQQDQLGARLLGEVTCCVADISPTPVFPQAISGDIAQRYEGQMSFVYHSYDMQTPAAQAHNLLVERAQADYLLLLGPENIVSPDIFAHLLGAFAPGQPSIGVAEARLIPLEHPKAYDLETGLTSWASGECLLVRANAFRVAGCLDAEGFPSAWDIDLSWRLRQQGYAIRYVPEALVFVDRRLDARGQTLLSERQRVIAAEAGLVMMHKWSYPELLEKALAQYAAASESYLRSAHQAFLKRQGVGNLPTPRDPDHTVGQITAAGFGPYRF